MFQHPRGQLLVRRMHLHLGLLLENCKKGCSAPCCSFRSGYVWHSNYWTTNWWAIGFCYWDSDKSSTSSHGLWCAGTSAPMGMAPLTYLMPHTSAHRIMSCLLLVRKENWQGRAMYNTEILLTFVIYSIIEDLDW